MFRQQGKLEVFDHGVLFHRIPTHKHQILFNFLDEGLTQDKGAFYVAGDESPQMIRQAMLNFGFDVKALEREGRLKIVNFDEWYIVDGKVEMPNIMTLWKKTYEEALEMGLKGLHVCGETGCFFRHNFVEELIEYEKNCGRKLKIPTTALCAYSIYDAKFLKANLFLDLVRSHSHVFSPSFNGLFNFENFYWRILLEKLKAVVEETCAKEILSFLNKWRPLLEADLDEGPLDLHTALESLIGPRAERIKEQVLLKIYENFGLELPYSEL